MKGCRGYTGANPWLRSGRGGVWGGSGAGEVRWGGSKALLPQLPHLHEGYMGWKAVLGS